MLRTFLVLIVANHGLSFFAIINISMFGSSESRENGKDREENQRESVVFL